jgi:hypothetical protein
MAEPVAVEYASEVKLFNKWSFDDVEPTGFFLICSRDLELGAFNEFEL